MVNAIGLHTDIWERVMSSFAGLHNFVQNPVNVNNINGPAEMSNVSGVEGGRVSSFSEVLAARLSEKTDLPSEDFLRVINEEIVNTLGTVAETNSSDVVAFLNQLDSGNSLNQLNLFSSMVSNTQNNDILALLNNLNGGGLAGNSLNPLSMSLSSSLPDSNALMLLSTMLR